MKYKAILFACLSSLILTSCSFSENKKEPAGKEEEAVPFVQEEPDLDYDLEIEQFPKVYSYVSEKEKPNGVKPLTKGEKAKYLNLESIPTEVNNTDFHVFALNKITYEKATLIVYLVKEIQDESSHEMDQLVLVIYNKEGKAMDVLSKNLQDNFSTREFEFTSPTEFNVVDTDSEYSPDPESEAEDIKNGREPQPSVSATYYQIDSSKLKFKELN